MKKNTSGPRFRMLLEEANITTTGFAEFLDTAPQNVHNWYTRGVPAHCMEEVARKLSVSSAWLRTGEGSKDSQHLRLPDDTGNTFDAQTIRGVYTVIEPSDVELAFYKEVVTAPGSSSTHVIIDSEQTIRLPRSHLDALEINHADAICALMSGNSMAERIEDGSTLAIDRGLTQIIDGEIYAIEHDGMLRIKYLHRLPGNALRLRSHNRAEYPDEIFRAAQIEEQNIRVLGWVFWWSTLNKRRPPVPFL
ncbi:S24 family peptidase [Pseudomonas vancouverensis]|uniref:Helix-turn-helix transcriptional regulator n=1 Tax=Pseudomonas vancouverensis TaxID=95300 RepID=A0A1H2PH04_PSEVA|nr:helix-turn-helix transcriptional regulator [Pseudomonas vancouverensis]KAB0492713.1 helix-turn-helix transcriptional regulator [Pseudomonas vancouverensis]TDB58338.1 helix-turn-helix transcriptional regulator [Pseudomonas vancouverensis]SDV17009.1 Phage repressor protein C, contains Cro/C1-type HTH and peptisase s24 domains [Pseudomonas vancouverensis]